QLAARASPVACAARDGKPMSRAAPTLAQQAAGRAVDSRLPRLLAGVFEHGAMGLREHLATHGELPHERARRRREAPLIELLEHAGLRGRGGAGFPTAKKLRAVARARRRAIVVINAAEGEPASLKDRTLCELAPHLMLDGGQLAAQALGADELIVCVCESSLDSVDSVAEAIAERRGLGGAPAQMRLSVVPSGYVAGQESALVSHLNGGP